MIGGTSDRGVVASCSYSSSIWNYSAMPMRMAQQRCPEAIVIKGNSGIYSKYSRMVTDIIKTSPLYEKSSVDEFYIDFTGMDRFHGVLKYGSNLRNRIIKETGLPISFVCPRTKRYLKSQQEKQPNNQIEISSGHEKAFGAFIGSKNSDGWTKDLPELMCRDSQIKPLQDMPVELMERAMGQNGIGIWKRLMGLIIHLYSV